MAGRCDFHVWSDSRASQAAASVISIVELSSNELDQQGKDIANQLYSQVFPNFCQSLYRLVVSHFIVKKDVFRFGSYGRSVQMLLFLSRLHGMLGKCLVFDEW